MKNCHFAILSHSDKHNKFKECKYDVIKQSFTSRASLTVKRYTLFVFVFFFVIRTFFYRNVEAEINQNFKNVLRTSLRLESIKNLFIWPICGLNDKHKVKVTNVN